MSNVLISVIVNHGKGSKVLACARENGIGGGTITFGKGTAKSSLLDYLCLTDIRREVVLMVAKEECAEKALEAMRHEFKFEKPGRGIAYTRSLGAVYGTQSIKNGVSTMDQKENNMYQQITVIVDKGNAEYVINAAEKAGSAGGTIINARGAGVHEKNKVFDMEIEPEKELVIILAETDGTEQIVQAIREALQIDEPGKGILYVQPITKTYGIYKKD